LFRDVAADWNWGANRYGQSLWGIFESKYTVTLRLNLIAFAIYVPAGFLLGIYSAVKKNTWIDHVIGSITLVLSSVPGFVMVFALIMVFAYVIPLFPSQYPSVLADNFVKFKALFIPIAALSFQPLAQLARALRGELIETLYSEHLLLAKTKGLNNRQLLFRHALRNSLVPVIQLIPASFLTALANAFIIELIYGIPGVALLFLDAIYRPGSFGGVIVFDSNTLVMITGFYVAIGLVSALVIDLAYAVIDPTMRIGSKRTKDN
jgi:oligopeptide transport system permease protein